jgi:acyl carrier protein
MEIELFVKKFEDQFDDIEPGSINSKTVFKTIDGWDSMTALSLIAMVDEEFSVKLSGDEIRKSETVEDIFYIVSNK